MEAPDKIYIEQKAIMYDLVWVEPCKPDDIEYIRKDALLEWAKEQHKSLMETLDPLGDDFGWGKRFAFHMVIDKISKL